MARYRIGEVSKFLDIPVETIRYYESKGIVNPEKDPDNKYRYYTAWDINFLTEYRKFKGYGFSQQEIQGILYEDDLPSFRKRIAEKQEAYEYKVKFYTQAAEKNQAYQETLARIDQAPFELIERPAYYYFFFRQNEDYLSDPQSLSMVKNWLNFFPLTDTVVIFDQEDVNQSVDDYAWGLALEEKHVQAFHVDINETVKYESPKRCVRTIVQAGGPGTLNGKLLAGPLQRMKDQGLKLKGSVFGNLLCRVHEDNLYKRYVELYIPI